MMQFALGFPPEIFSKKIGETKYALNLIPFGGYVKIFGENPDEESLHGPDSARALVHAAWWKQIIILLSGISMNIVFAWVLISSAFMIGLPTAIDDQYKDKAVDTSVIILSVLKDSPSDLAGLKEGDHILAITSGTVTKNQPSIIDVQDTITKSKGILNIEYQRGIATSSVQITAKDGVVSGKAAIGISMALIGTVKYSFFQSIYQGAKFTAIETGTITKGLYSFIHAAVLGQGSSLSEVAGPVGIAGMVGEARNIGFSYLLSFIAMISINLAVLNVVPFPALDGGRVFFILIEIITRKKIKPSIGNIINAIGFSILIGLMLFVTYKDIARLIH